MRLEMTERNPEAAMAREQVLEEALERELFDLVDLARDSRSDMGGEVEWVHPRGAIVKEFAKRIAALASTRQEPAPAADAEEVAFAKSPETVAAEIVSSHFGKTVPNLERSIASAIEGDRKWAALRRYAGDGGVTEEQVEAAHHAFWRASPRLAEEGGTKPAIREALEAAARAKPSEKGGAR